MVVVLLPPNPGEETRSSDESIGYNLSKFLPPASNSYREDQKETSDVRNFFFFSSSSETPQVESVKKKRMCQFLRLLSHERKFDEAKWWSW